MAIFQSLKIGHGSLYGAMVEPFKCVSNCSPSYFEFIKEYVTSRVDTALPQFSLAEIYDVLC